MNSALILDGIMIFMGIIIEAAPFIFLGILVSAIIHVFVKEEHILRFFPKNPYGQLLAASVLGFLFPVCECGNIPVARRMILKGLPAHVAITFLLSAPVFNPIVIFATYAAFRMQPEIVYLRLIFTLIVSFGVGMIFYFAKNKSEIVRKELLKHVKNSDHNNNNNHNHTHSHHDHTHDQNLNHTHCSNHGSKFSHMCDAMKREFFEMGSILVFGGLLASFFQIIFPRSYITSISEGPISSIISMMLLAAIISICSNVDAFFALSYSTTFSNGAILAFLVFGPMIDIKALLMLRTTFTWKTIFWITVFVFQSVFFITLFMNLNIS